MKKLFLFVTPMLLFASELYYYNNGEKVALTPFYETASKRDDGTNFYQNQYGFKVGINDYLLAKLFSTTLIIDIEQKYNIKLIGKITDTIYKFQATSSDEAILVSNALIENKEAKFAHPDFIREIHRR